MTTLAGPSIKHGIVGGDDLKHDENAIYNARKII